MGKIETAISWMEKTANDNTHGYSQVHRWGPDYDCSSSVITAWQNAGVPVKTNGATYTGNMYNVFKKCGFKDITNTVDLKTGKGLERGDVLLNIKHHVAMYCGNGHEVEASIDENGSTVGRLTGDQTGREFLIRRYRNYPWDKVLRFAETTTPSKPVSTKAPIYKDPGAMYGIKYKVSCSSLMMRSDAKITSKIATVLHKGDVVTWYGYYKVDAKGNKWLYVTNGKNTGYSCSGENGKTYLKKA